MRKHTKKSEPMSFYENHYKKKIVKLSKYILNIYQEAIVFIKL